MVMRTHDALVRRAALCYVGRVMKRRLNTMPNAQRPQSEGRFAVRVRREGDI